MARENYTQLRGTDMRMIWLQRIAKQMGLNAAQHKDRVKIYDLALAAFCAGVTGATLTDPEPWERDLSHYEYRRSQEIYSQIAGEFIPVLAALMRDADTDNTKRLRREFPAIAAMLQKRYNAPCGVLPEIDSYSAEEWYERQLAEEDERETEVGGVKSTPKS